MKIFSLHAYACAFLAAGLMLAATRGQTEDDCNLSALSGAAVEQFSIYDKDLYLEPDCVNGASPLPVHCNYMGLGQECRGCFLTCDGAMKYMDDFAEEIAEWGTDAIVHFCSDAEVDGLEAC